MSSTTDTFARPRLRLPDLPIAVWLLLGALATALASGLEASRFLAAFNEGWGRSLGDFAVVLLPSFMLATALAGRAPAAAGTSAIAVGPIAAAGMVCPDTGYAALSPIAGGRRLPLAFSSYAGFKLLFPAGPLLVATGLGVAGTKAFALALVLFVPVWVTGLLWSRWFTGTTARPTVSATGRPSELLRTLAPFGVLVALIVVGVVAELSPWPVLDFLTRPPGALLAAAVLALADRPADERRACVDSGIRRTAQLLFLIGAASALGAVLVHVLPFERLVTVSGGIAGVLSVVMLTAGFKIVQGSSMATFAAVTPLVAPFVAAGGLTPHVTVLAVCVGSLVAVLPNDSFYWLVRQDALEHTSERTAMIALVGGTLLQGLAGVAGLLALHALGWLN